MRRECQLAHVAPTRPSRLSGSKQSRRATAAAPATLLLSLLLSSNRKHYCSIMPRAPPTPRNTPWKKNPRLPRRQQRLPRPRASAPPGELPQRSRDARIGVRISRYPCSLDTVALHNLLTALDCAFHDGTGRSTWLRDGAGEWSHRGLRRWIFGVSPHVFAVDGFMRALYLLLYVRQTAF